MEKVRFWAEHLQLARSIETRYADILSTIASHAARLEREGVWELIVQKAFEEEAHDPAPCPATPRVFAEQLDAMTHKQAAFPYRFALLLLQNVIRNDATEQAQRRLLAATFASISISCDALRAVDAALHEMIQSHKTVVDIEEAFQSAAALAEGKPMDEDAFLMTQTAQGLVRSCCSLIEWPRFHRDPLKERVEARPFQFLAGLVKHYKTRAARAVSSIAAERSENEARMSRAQRELVWRELNAMGATRASDEFSVPAILEHLLQIERSEAELLDLRAVVRESALALVYRTELSQEDSARTEEYNCLRAALEKFMLGPDCQKCTQPFSTLADVSRAISRAKQDANLHGRLLAQLARSQRTMIEAQFARYGLRASSAEDAENALRMLEAHQRDSDWAFMKTQAFRAGPHRCDGFKTETYAALKAVLKRFAAKENWEVLHPFGFLAGLVDAIQAERQEVQHAEMMRHKSQYRREDREKLSAARMLPQ